MKNDVVWCIKRKNLMPILQVSATSMEKQDEIYMLFTALSIIAQAYAVRGRIIPERPDTNGKAAIEVSFSLIFKSENEINDFICGFQKE